MTLRNKSRRDLKKPINSIILRNQKPDKGQKLILSIDGLRHELIFDEDLFIIERLEKKMRSEIGWFEQISSHPPSIGTFYESLIRNAIEEVLPSKVKLGSGFVYDSAKRTASPQIDFILYNDELYPALYKNDNFVVVDSKNVISCIEVKKTLNRSILNKILETYLNVNLGSSPHSYQGVQFLNIFIFQSRMSIERIYQYTLEYLQAYFDNFKSTTIKDESVFFCTYNIVLPNIYFFDRTGFIQSYCVIGNDYSLSVKFNLNSSSLAGQSLGEFLTFVTKSQKDTLSLDITKNFLSYTLVQPEKESLICDNIPLMRKLSMDEIIFNFPNEVEYLKKGLDNGKYHPYGAIFSSAFDLTKMTLRELEKMPTFQWLVSELE